MTIETVNSPLIVNEARRAVARDRAAQLCDLGDDVAIHVGMQATQYALISIDLSARC